VECLVTTAENTRLVHHVRGGLNRIRTPSRRAPQRILRSAAGNPLIAVSMMRHDVTAAGSLQSDFLISKRTTDAAA